MLRLAAAQMVRAHAGGAWAATEHCRVATGPPAQLEEEE